MSYLPRAHRKQSLTALNIELHSSLRLLEQTSKYSVPVQQLKKIKQT